jgi:hypothetical protein
MSILIDERFARNMTETGTRTITREALITRLCKDHPDKSRDTITFLVDLHAEWRAIAERQVRSEETPSHDVVIPLHEVNGPRGDG